MDQYATKAMEHTVDIVGSFLFNSVWQVSLIASVASACAWLLRRAPATYRHWLWVSALALCVIVPVAGMQPSSTAYVALQAARAVNHLSVGSPDVSTNSSGSTGGLSGSFWLADALVPKNVPIPLASGVALILTGLYLAFLLYSLARFSVGCIKASQIGRNASGEIAAGTVHVFAETCRQSFGLGAVRMLCSRTIGVPLTLGVVRPIIILPQTLAASASPDMLRAVIGHEMAHIKRRDFLLNLIYELIYLPISFHPAAALVKRRIAQTRELACDEMVAGRLLSRYVYARSLITVADGVVSAARPAHTLGVFDADNLEERVMKLTDRTPNMGAGAGKLLASIAATALALTGVAASAYSVRVGIPRPHKEAPVAAPAQSDAAFPKGSYRVTRERMIDGKDVQELLRSDVRSGRHVYSQTARQARRTV